MTTQCTVKYALGKRMMIEGEECVQLIQCKLEEGHSGVCNTYPALRKELPQCRS